MAELAELSLADASRAISAGEVSPAELVDAVLERIARVESSVKAYAAIDPERARRDAGQLTEELTSRGRRSALHGIPFAIKDVADVEGFPTRAGSHVLDQERAAASDAPVIARLRDAGAIILGKATTHEFASGIDTPPTRNPWDTSRIPGGSSGGSGAALAAGESIGAVGTDSGGSIRIPAAFCGVCGLRPRRGIAPLDGVVPFSWTHDTIGPMGRSAEDLAIAWRTMANDHSATTDVPAARLRLGVLPLAEVLECEPDVERAYDDAAEVLEAQRFERRDVRLAPFSDWGPARLTVVCSDMAAAAVDAGWYPERKELYSEEALVFLESAFAITGPDLTLARRTLDRLAKEYLALFDEIDVLLVPTAIRTAPEVSEVNENRGPGRPPPLVGPTMRATGPVGYCGLASASVPMGFARDGMPVGIQFIAHEESTALSAAARFQEATDHHQARAPLASMLPTDA